MNSLPDNEKLKFLRDKNLELVCFAAYQVNLHFETDVAITIFGSFTHVFQEKVNLVKNVDFPLQNSGLMRLVGQRTKNVQIQLDGTLTLTFSNNEQLIIQGENDAYEAYHIKHGDHVIVR